MPLKFSIITVSYNSAKTIEHTLGSVAFQRYDHIEHLVIDGASSDNTISIVNRFPHISRTVCESDNGLYDAMNKGIAYATGDVLVFLNSDDYYCHAGVLSKVANIFEETKCDALYADLEYVQAQNTKKVVRHWKSGTYSSQNFYWGWMPPHPTFFVRRSVYESLGGFDTRLRSSADYELMLRFLLKNGISVSYLPEVIVRMRTGGKSNASLAHRYRANIEDREAWRMNGLRPRFYTLWLKPLSKIFQYRI